MINRFRWCICCILLLILQFLFSPVTTIAVAETQIEGEPKSLPSKDSDLAAPAVENSPPPQTIDGSRQSLPSKEGDGQVADGFLVPEKRNLAELIGKSEISVLADVDGQFVKSMAENQIMEEEDFARQMDEANLLESIRAGRNFNRDSLAAMERTRTGKSANRTGFCPSAAFRVGACQSRL